MGVRGLWDVVEPVSKPTQLESLRKQRLAVDASIWIYQFLKAVRDSSGNVVKYAHIVGFFRRICKLLFFGIKPVFVFDGAAPALKRDTINKRRERREGHRESTKRTAARLLTLQMQKMEQERNGGPAKKNKRKRNDDLDEDNFVYYDERNVNEAERINADKKPKKDAFQPQDQYHLPEIDDLGKMGDQNDPRLMTEDELQAYADEFQNQLTSGLYDTMEVDFESAEFKSLPLATQYQLVNTARLRSRLRMGYSQDQLEERFKDRMEFSKFQINRVAQRNYLTQKIMNIVGMDDEGTQKRIAGQRGGAYVLDKNDTGYTLALQNNKTQNTVILDSEGEENEGDDDDEEEEWESVDLGVQQDSAGPSTSQPEWNDEMAQDPQLPSELRNFETELQRQKLYTQIQEQVALESIFEEENKREKGRGSRKGSSQPGFMPFLLKGDNVDIEKLKQQSQQETRKPLANSSNTLDFSTSSLFGPMKSSREKRGTSRETVTNEPSDAARFEAETTEDHGLQPTSHVLGGPEKNKGRDGDRDIEADDTQQQEQEDEEVDNPPEPLPPWFDRAQENEQEQEKQTATKTSAKIHKKLQRELEEEQGIEHDEFDGEELEPVELDKTLPPKSEPQLQVGSVKSFQEPESTVGRTQARETEVVDNADDNAVPTVEHVSEDAPELVQEAVQYENEEDEQLVNQMLGELEENERFAKSLNNGAAASDYANEIERMRKHYQNEQRDADQVSNTMVEECQTLLQMFGIPYVTAPMEAEAQCAKLVELGLVDGVVTDDSDCFLFGGNKIYKNMFNQAKWVERYDSDDVENEFGLDRTKLIELAQLLGSDYTEGLPGIGPVQGLELLAEFGDLAAFRDWWNEEQKTANPDPQALTDFQKRFRKKHLTKVFLPDTFPDRHVRDAYLNPQVDEDATEFEWGRPRLDQLRQFLTSSTGWSQERIDEMLVPVIRDMNKPQPQPNKAVQSTLTDYVGVSPLKRMEVGHKRMYKAVEKLRAKNSH